MRREQETKLMDLRSGSAEPCSPVACGQQTRLQHATRLTPCPASLGLTWLLPARRAFPAQLASAVVPARLDPCRRSTAIASDAPHWPPAVTCCRQQYLPLSQRPSAASAPAAT